MLPLQSRSMAPLRALPPSSRRPVVARWSTGDDSRMLAINSPCGVADASVGDFSHARAGGGEGGDRRQALLWRSEEARGASVAVVLRK